jgi:hypothetical protein
MPLNPLGNTFNPKGLEALRRNQAKEENLTREDIAEFTKYMKGKVIGMNSLHCLKLLAFFEYDMELIRVGMESENSIISDLWDFERRALLI